MIAPIVQENASGAATIGRVLARFAARLKQTISDISRRQDFRHEIDDLERRGALDPLLADLGLNRAELDSMVEGFPQSDRLLAAMAQRLGVNLEKLEGADRFELGRTCSLCVSHRRCRRWLSAEPNSGLAEFCPNRAFFEELRSR